MSSVYEIVTDEICKKLEAGVIPWNKPWNAIEGFNGLSRTPYNGLNVLLLAGLPYKVPCYLSFNQVKQFKGRVKKGEHGNIVTFFKQYETKDKETGEPVKIPLLRYYRVFNIDQCTGLKLPDKTQAYIDEQIEIHDNKELKSASDIWESYQAKPELKHGGEAAYYREEIDAIQLPDMSRFLDSSSYYATLFHEATHSTGHENRLNRRTLKTYHARISERSREELVADIGSAFLCREAGIDTEGTLTNTASYCQGWSSYLRSDPKAISTAASQATKAAKHILGTV